MCGMYDKTFRILATALSFTHLGTARAVGSKEGTFNAYINQNFSTPIDDYAFAKTSEHIHNPAQRVK